MTCGIYVITNQINGMQYVGQSINIEERFKQHCYGHEQNSAIDKAIKELGVENFTFEIICTCPDGKLNDEEKKFIRLYDSFNQGYNRTTGGGSGGEFSHLSKEKMSKARTTTGFLNVHKVSCPTTFQGFIWKYKVMIRGETIIFQNCDLNELKNKVLEKGLPWKIINKNKASTTEKENEYYLNNLKKSTNTGFLGVSKTQNKRVKQGFIYQYNLPYNSKGINSSFGSISFEKLRKKVLDKGLPWELINRDIAKECGLI